MGEKARSHVIIKNEGVGVNCPVDGRNDDRRAHPGRPRLSLVSLGGEAGPASEDPRFRVLGILEALAGQPGVCDRHVERARPGGVPKV